MLRWARLLECESPPEGWQVTEFSAIVDVIAGQSPPSETYNEKQVGFPFLQGNGDFSSTYPTPRIWCSSPAKTSKVGDTLISVRAPVGELNRSDRDYAIGRGLAALRAKNCDPNFLFHAIQRWRWCLQRVAQGTTFDAVTARHFHQLYVAIPVSSDEQSAIAHILDAVDSAIERTREAVERAREVKRSILQKFFYAALGETAYADRPKKKLPTGWLLSPVETLLAEDPKNGVSPIATSQPPGTPTFSIAAIREGKVDLDKQGNLKYAQVPDNVARLFQVRRGDILIVRGNANPNLVGKAGVIDRFPDGCIYPDITKRVIFKGHGEKIVMPEYAVLTWNHPIVHNQVLRRAKTSNGTLKINNRDVKQVIMLVPPINEQKKIVDLVNAVEMQIDAYGVVLRSYEQLKRSLMHDLLTGKVRVGRTQPELALQA